MIATRIAVAAHKGGAGKTTLAVNLAAELAALGRRVLLIDADPQGAAAAALGLLEVAKPTLYEVLTDAAHITDAVRATGVDGLDLLPSNLDLSGLEVELPGRPRWQAVLHDALTDLEGHDLAVLDTAPGLGILPYVALVASTAALVVTPPEFLAYRALSQVLETVERARQLAPELRLLGIVPTFVTRQTLHARDVLEVMGVDHGDSVLPEIPRRVALQDAALAGRPIRDYDPRNDAAEAFARLAKEVIARAEATQHA